MPMNTWMIPKNKRDLTHIPGTLLAFSEINNNTEWSGHRDIQAKFEKLLEAMGQKGGGNQYDPHSGGARTYEAQLDALGLIYWDEVDGRKILRLTLAGEAILAGKNPTTILQHQLMKLQYPSPYSLRTQVGINPKSKIRPFLFLMRLLLDPDIGYLENDEIGFIILPYAKTASDYASVKKKILQYRKTKKFTFPNTFMEDTFSTRGRNHTFEERLEYLHDKANIFINYLDSCHFILRPEKQKIICNPSVKKLVESYLTNEKPLLDDPENSVRFQRRFGLDPDHSKDTRLFTESSQISASDILKRMVLVAFSRIASKKLCLDISDEIIELIRRVTGAKPDFIRKILSNKDIDGLNYFEENYINMANRGREDAIDFEIATAELFRESLGFRVKHVGQVKPLNRDGGNPDIIIISDPAEYCGILDAKAYSAYGLDHDHQLRMRVDYVPNVDEHSDGKEVKFFAYVSGDFSNVFTRKLKGLAGIISKEQKNEIHASGITARNLIHLCQLSRMKPISHDNLRKLFSSDDVISLEQIEALAT